MVFKSKIGGFFVTLVTVLPAYLLYQTYFLYLKGLHTDALICLFSLVFTLALFLGAMGTTKYVIDDEELFVSSLGFGSRIRLEDIVRIEKTTTLASAPALSLDRLRIIGKTGTFKVVSPMERQEFLDLLKERNSKIDFLL